MKASPPPHNTHVRTPYFVRLCLFGDLVVLLAVALVAEELRVHLYVGGGEGIDVQRARLCVW